jgi:TRAP-type C4-dicarboxylate transport system permease large subunit
MTGLKLEKVVYACLAFIPTLVIALLILTYVPSLSTWLPGLLFRD